MTADTIAADISTAFTETTIDTFDALYKSPDLTNPAVVKPLDGTYGYLAAVTSAPAQLLFDTISRAAADIIAASDHRMLVGGHTPRALTCDTCGKLLSHHSADADAYTGMHKAISDIETIIAMHKVPDPRKS